MIQAIRLSAWPVRMLLALFALYALWTVPSLLPRWGASGAGFLLLAAWLGLAAVAWPLARGRLAGIKAWAPLIGIVMAIRLVVLWITWGHAPTGDPMIYVQLARDLLAGKGLVFTDPFTGVSFRALYPPAFPLLLAGVGALFGLGPVSLWTVNLLLDLIAAGLLLRIGDRVGVRGAGRAAAWLYLIWPTFVLATPFAQKEPLVAVLVLGQALCLIRLRDHPAVDTGSGAVFGVLAGLLALTQPGLAPLPMLLGVLLLPLIGLRPLFGLAWRSLPVMLLVLAPWWIRNGLLLHHFVPLTSTGGIGLWIGNNPAASGNWMPLPPDMAQLPELEQSARAAAVAKVWIIAHPFEMLRLNLTKLVRSFGVEQFTLLRFSLLKPALATAWAPMLFPLLQGALFLVLAGAAGVARRTVRGAGGPWLLLLLAAAILQILIFDVWFEFAERHRYFIMPFLFLIVGAAMTPRRPANEPA